MGSARYMAPDERRELVSSWLFNNRIYSWRNCGYFLKTL